MALGHTIVHLPQRRHPWSIVTASCSFPFCRARIALRTLVFTNLPAVQLAVQLPQAIHLSTSGSISTSLANFSVSVLSKSILELGLRVKPNFPIICCFYLWFPIICFFLQSGNCGLRGLLHGLRANCREESLDLCRRRQRKLPACCSSEGRKFHLLSQRIRHFLRF